MGKDVDGYSLQLMVFVWNLAAAKKNTNCNAETNENLPKNVLQLQSPQETHKFANPPQSPNFPLKMVKNGSSPQKNDYPRHWAYPDSMRTP